MGFNCPSATRGKSIKCRAAVARKAGEPLVIEEIEVLAPKAWEVRIKIVCTTLCHSDVTFWQSKEGPLSFFPRILGHEAAGVVESVGEHVADLKEGDTVIPVFLRECGECKDCRSRKGNSCSNAKFAPQFSHVMPRDYTTRFLDVKGQPIYHSLGVSSFSEYTVVDITHVVKISPEIPADKACLFGCGVPTGLGAVTKVAQVEEGSSVAIFGLGSIGLADRTDGNMLNWGVFIELYLRVPLGVAEGARLQKASKIIGVDINPEKFELGKRFGMTDFINPTSCTEKSVSQLIQEMTDGGADYTFECIGLASLMQDAFDSSHQCGGKTIILGVEMSGTPMNINTYELLKGRSIIGCLYGGFKQSDIPLLSQRYLDKELHLDEFITHEVKLEDINNAIDLLLGGKSLRCIVWMDK